MIQLRMRGVPLPLVASALVALSPLGFIGWQMGVRHLHVEPTMSALAVACACLPWLSRLAGRLTYRAAVDDIALHVAGEAMPWNTITSVTPVYTWRRDVLVIERGETSRIDLVTSDLFTGRLEPFAELKKRLPKL